MSSSKSEQQRQINQMMRFIEQEAQEKAEEIITKAHSENSATRNQQIRKRTEELKEKFDKLSDEVKIEKKIAKSRQLTAARIKTMQHRDEKMNAVKAAVTEQLASVSSNPEYPNLIKSLLAEGLLRMMEKTVEVRCREVDRKVVESQLKAAVALYEAKVKESANVELKCAVTLSTDPEHWLPGPPSEGKIGCTGGIVLLANEGKIKLDNTLDKRLDLAMYAIKPTLRAICFGEREHFANTVVVKHKLTSG